MKKSLQFYLGVLIFSVLISIPLLIPYLHSGYFPTHDGEWAVVRLADMFREIKDLQFPPRFSGNLNFGYGYPLFNFAYPFPYYLGLLIHFLGFGFVDSVKIVFALSIPVSAFFMFLASRNIWKNDFAGVISSVLYLYFPYRMVDLFVRGSIGESLAFALFPIILLCLSKLIDNPKSVGFKLFGGILFACLILTHNIMAVLFSISLLIFFIGNFINEGKKIIFPFVSVIGLGFVLSAYFWIPALFEKHNILLSQIPISDRNLYFVSIKSLLFSKWGYGVPTDSVNGFTYQIGWPFLAILLVAAVTLFALFYKKIKKTKIQILAGTLLVGILLYSLLLFSFSKPFWKIPLLSEINYPWTILSQLALLVSVLAGFLAGFTITKYLSLGTMIIAIALYLPFAKPQEYVNRGDNFYFTNDATTTSSNELMPLWVKTFPVERAYEKISFVKGNGAIENVVTSSKKIEFNANLAQDSIVRINTIYYPGWKIFVDGKESEISFNNQNGVMDLALEKGNHHVEGSFSETTVRLVADLISILGIIIVIIIFSKTYLLKYIKYENH